MTSDISSHVINCHCYCLPFDDIDTDQIIPGQFLTTTQREGLGKFCFHSWRHDESGCALDEHPLTEFDNNRHQVLVAGRNFGCGSSREHAPWALLDMGVRAVISSRFADIFFNNALKNGLLPITLDEAVVEFLHQHPHHPVKIDIQSRSIEIEGHGSFEFPLDPFAAHCIIEGIDQMDFILQQDALIRQHEERRPG